MLFLSSVKQSLSFKQSLSLLLGLTVFSGVLLAHTLHPAAALSQTPPVAETTIPPAVKLPDVVAQKLLRQVAKDQQVPVRRLKVAEVKSDFLDGCLDIYPVNPSGNPTGCRLKIASLPGYRAIITDDRQTWVYHLYDDARKIAYNPTASRSRNPVRVSYELFGGEPGSLEADVIFQSSLSGDLTGRTATIKLTRDGKITRFITAPNIRSVPQVIKTLSPEQVEQFQRFLNRQRFPNLNGLSYLTSAALADYPTTTYQTQDTVVQLIDLEKDKLPIALRQIFNTWERLIKSDSPVLMN
jgi:hypothetical protein